MKDRGCLIGPYRPMRQLLLYCIRFITDVFYNESAAMNTRTFP